MQAEKCLVGGILSHNHARRFVVVPSEVSRLSSLTCPCPCPCRRLGTHESRCILPTPIEIVERDSPEPSGGGD